jgi:hypothetical protein
MSIRIYQSYYKEEQKEHLDPEFFPYDNTSNPVQNLYEHYLYHRIREQALADGVEYWGMFSWQWRKKLSHASVEQILDAAEQCTGAGCDVVIYNPYVDDEAVSFNIWEQGAWSHPYILHLGRAVLEKMGEDPNLVFEPMDYGVYLAANYMLGNQKYWDGLLEFLDRFVASLDQLSPEDSVMMKSSAGYEPNPKLDYTGFICERLISTYLVKQRANQNLKIGAYVISSELSSYKQEALQNRDKEKLLYWDEQRPAKGYKFATEWINALY